MAEPDGMTLAEWLSVAVLGERDRAGFLRTLAAVMPAGQALTDLADWIDRDVAAKRAILELHTSAGQLYEDGPHYCSECGSGEPHEYPTEWPCPTVRHLATAYAGRDGWCEEWRPQ